MLEKEKRIGIIILVIWILGFSLFTGLQLFYSNAIGGGGGFIGAAAVNTAVNATTKVIAFNAPAMVKGTYLVLGISTYSPSITVSSVSDTAGNTWIKAVQSKHFEDTEIWFANYTGTNFAANSATITFSSSSESTVMSSLLSGVLSNTIQNGTNFGTTSPLTTASFTPNTNSMCVWTTSLDTGSATIASFTGTFPNLFQFRVSTQLAASSFFNQGSFFVNNWLASYGAITFSQAFTPTTAPQWDIVYTCLQGGPATTSTTTSTTTTTTITNTTTTTKITTNPVQPSGGIQQVQLNSTFSGASSTIKLNFKTPPNSDFGKIVQGHFVFVSIVSNFSNTKVSTITDTLGLTFAKVIAVDTVGVGDNEIWLANQTKTTNIDTITVTMNSTVTALGAAFEVSGLTSLTPDNAVSNIGNNAFPQVASIIVPLDDFCLGGVNTNHANNLVANTSIPFAPVFTAVPAGGGEIVANNMNGSTTTAVLALKFSAGWNMLLTCYPSSGLNIITSVSTITGTVIPEPAGSTDFLILLLAILISLAMFIIGIYYRHPLPTFIAAMVLLLMFLGLNSSPQIVYGSNIFQSPSWLNEVLILFVVIGFVAVIYQLFRRVR